MTYISFDEGGKPAAYVYYPNNAPMEAGLIVNGDLQPVGNIASIYYAGGAIDEPICQSVDVVPRIDAIGQAVARRRRDAITLYVTETHKEAEELQKTLDRFATGSIVATAGDYESVCKWEKERFHYSSIICMARGETLDALYEVFSKRNNVRQFYVETETFTFESKDELDKFVRQNSARSRGDTKRYADACRALGERIDEEERDRAALEVRFTEDWDKDAPTPEPLGESAHTIADEFRVPFRAVAIMFLTAYSAIQNGARVPWGRGIVDPFISCSLIGGTGDAKSPVLDLTIKPLLALGKQERARAADRQKDEKALVKTLAEIENKRAKAEMAKELTKNERDEKAFKLIDDSYQTIKRKLAVASADAHTYVVTGWKSAQEAERILAANANTARVLNQTDRGCLVALHEGARILGATQGDRFATDQMTIISNILDGCFNDSGRNKYPPDLPLKGSILACVQPETLTVDQVTSIAGQGGLGRLFWTAFPEAKEDIKKGSEKLPWHDLFNIELPPKEYRLANEADKIYVEWRQSLVDRKRAASRQGNIIKKGFLSKLRFGGLKVALNFHLIEEASKRAGGAIDEPDSEIGAATMRMAIGFCEAMIEEFDKTFRFIKNVRETRDQQPANILDGLSQPALALYQYAVKRGWMALTELNQVPGLYFFRTQTKRSAAEKELIDRGLWIIGEHEHKNKRRAVIDETRRVTDQEVLYHGETENQEGLEEV